MRPDRHPVKTMRCTAIDRGFDADTPRLPRGATRGDARPSEARPSGGALISLALFALLSLSACGYVGNPQAPTLDIPQQINDLRFVQYGDKIRAEFTNPPETTEGFPLKSLRSFDFRVGPLQTPGATALGPLPPNPSTALPSPAPASRPVPRLQRNGLERK